ncbi:PREDICTED: uncharacterized protein LOC108762998 [Trachymyrmex cornetzi]|uniref:uncharacterized protein LOC108762998 n=1 Tax=Trachymyrmex cornetzi TaxID=471704 RepID=UPI00084F5EEF|nr:PREDICTED: uncharacterized protein LOC108762998 [Trachymyrmex cornetzi]
MKTYRDAGDGTQFSALAPNDHQHSKTNSIQDEVCAELLIDRKIRNCICISDSRAAINALAKTSTESSVVWDCMQALDKLGETSEITLVWVPRHQGIPGNERADGLAKPETEIDSAEQTVGVSFVLGKRKIKEMLELEHLNSWKKIKGC